MRRSRSHAVSITLSTIGALATGIVFLPAADEAPTLEQRLEALDQEVKILKRKAEIEAESAAAKAATAKDAPKFTANAKDGFSLSSADGSHKLRIGGSAQLETVLYLNDDEVPKNNTFFVRRVRPYLQGTVAKHFDYNLVLDFAGGSQGVVLDANVTANILPEFKIQAGRFKTPFGLEYLQSDPVTAFIERGFPTQLAPGRDAGVQVLGELLGGRLTYQVGFFNGPGDRADRDTDASDDKDAIARLYGAPFKDTGIVVLEGLNIGIAGSYGGFDDPTTSSAGAITATSLPTYVSPGNTQFFGYVNAAAGNSAVPHGSRTRFSPQLYYTWGPWDVLAEYIESETEIRLVTTATGAVVSDAVGVTHTAWQVETGYVLTGENASFRGVMPNGGGIGSSGWGALQLVLRVAELEIDDKTFDEGFASRATSAESALNLGIGLNWWLNRNLRFAVNYDHTTFEAGGGGTNADPEDKEDEQVIRTRLQLVF
jgi:phosphate-selective porin OprO and OprP